MARTWPTVHRSRSLKMFSKSSLLLLFVATTLSDAHLFTPFDLVDNYVDQFRVHVDELGKIAERYYVIEEEYDSLSHEDAKLLLSKYSFFQLINVKITFYIIPIIFSISWIFLKLEPNYLCFIHDNRATKVNSKYFTVIFDFLFTLISISIHTYIYIQ